MRRITSEGIGSYINQRDSRQMLDVIMDVHTMETTIVWECKTSDLYSIGSVIVLLSSQWHICDIKWLLLLFWPLEKLTFVHTGLCKCWWFNTKSKHFLPCFHIMIGYICIVKCQLYSLGGLFRVAVVLLYCKLRGVYNIVPTPSDKWGGQVKGENSK